MKNEKIKFAHQTKKGQSVYYIELNIRSKQDEMNTCVSYKSGLFIETLKIVHQTDRKIALSNEWLTVLDRKLEGSRTESYHNHLENVCVSVKTKETYFPNGIFASGYFLDNSDKSITIIKNKIVQKINKEYGFLRDINIEDVVKSFSVTYK